MTFIRAGDSSDTRGGTAGWFVPWRFGLLLGLLFLVSFLLVVTGLHAFCFYDAGQFEFPVAFFHRESFWRGEVPLWNPSNNCGLPFLAQWNTMALYPLSAFYLIFPLPWSYDVFCLGHLLLAGMGMYFLARHWTGSALAGAVAGTVFAFNGLSWYGLMWAHMEAALGWMPWVVLASERGWREGGRCVVLGALAAGMQLLSGGVEVIILTWFFLAIWWLAQIIRTDISRVKMAVRLLAIGGLAAGLAAAQLLPFLDLLRHSQRNAGFGRSDYAAIPLTGWANYLVPLFHFGAGMHSQGVPGFTNQITWTSSYYLGVAVIALALVAALSKGNVRTRVLAGLALFSLLMALGSRGHIYDWIRMLVPPLGLMRFPSKFVLLPTFALPLLAAFGLSRLLDAPADEQQVRWRRVRWISVAILALMLAIIWVAVKRPLPGDEVEATVKNAFLRILFFSLIAGCIVFLYRGRHGKFEWLWQTCLILLLWCDVLTHAPNLTPTADSSVLEPDMIRTFFNWDQELRPGVSRAMQTQAAYRAVAIAGFENSAMDINGRRLALFLNYNLLDHAAKLDGFFSLYLQDCTRVCDQLSADTNLPPGLLDFLGVSLMSNPANLVGWTRRDTFLPMVTGGQKPLFVGEPETFSALFRAGFEPRRDVYLPLEAREVIQATNPANVQIDSFRFSNQRLAFEARADAPAMIVVAQAYYHPWQAYVDGQSARLWKANYAFQALEVPAGNHRVTLVYEDRNFRIGCILSLATMLACAIIWFSCRKPDSSPANPDGHLPSKA